MTASRHNPRHSEAFSEKVIVELVLGLSYLRLDREGFDRVGLINVATIGPIDRAALRVASDNAPKERSC